MKNKTDIQRLTELYSSLESRGRFLPNPVEMEKNVLGCVMTYAENCDMFFEHITENPFYSETNRVLYELCREIYLQKQYPEMLTLFQVIEKRGLATDISVLDLVGYTSEVAPAYFSQHLEIVKECSQKRKLVMSFERLVGECLINEQPLVEILDGADSEILKIRSGDKKNEPKSMKSLLHLLDGEDVKDGLKTGYSRIDDSIRKNLGLQGGDFVIIGARPSVGKTTLAINLAVNMILDGEPVLFFSAEMTNNSIVKKVFECVSGEESWKLDVRKYEHATLNRKAVEEARKILSTELLSIDDSSGLTPLDIRARVARWKYRYGIKAIFVDYIQILKPVGNHTNRESEIRSISQSLKEIAKEFGVVVFALSQLNRKSGDRADKKPSVSDLRDSGSLEQDADIILMPYDPKQTDTGNKETIRELTVIVAKNREGYCTEVAFDFHANISRFVQSNRELDTATERLQEMENDKPKYQPQLLKAKDIKPEGYAPVVYEGAPF